MIVEIEELYGLNGPLTSTLRGAPWDTLLELLFPAQCVTE